MKYFTIQTISVLFLMNVALCLSPLEGSPQTKAQPKDEKNSEKQAEVRNGYIEMYPYAVQANRAAAIRAAAIHAVGMAPSGSYDPVPKWGQPSEKVRAMNEKICSFYQSLQAELQNGRISYDQYRARLACWYTDPGRNPCAALSDDGALAAISHWTGNVTIYNAKTGDKQCVLKAPESLPLGFILPKMQFSKDGKSLAVLVSRSNVSDEFYIYETQTGTLRQKIQTPCFLFFPSGKVRMLTENEAAACAKDALGVRSDVYFSLKSMLEAGMSWDLPAVTGSVQKQGRFAAMSENSLVYAMDVPRQMKISGGFSAMDTTLVGIVCHHNLRVPGDVSFYPILDDECSSHKILMNPSFSETLNSFLFTTNTGDIVKLPRDTWRAEFILQKNIHPATAAEKYVFSYPYPQNAAAFTSIYGLQIQCGLPRFRMKHPDGTIEEYCAPRRDYFDELFSPQTACLEKSGEEILFVQKIQPGDLQTLHALFPGMSRRVVSSYMTSDGRYVAAGIQNMEKNLETGSVILWDVETEKVIATLSAPQKSVTFHLVQFTPDNKNLVVLALSCGNQECTLLRIEVFSGKVLQKISLKK